jgi:biopolymer transport protein TolQ
MGVNVGAQMSLWHSLTEASLIVQLILLALIGLSIFCWTVTFAKFRQLNAMTRLNDAFLKRFWKASSLEDLNQDLGDFTKGSGIARLFEAGYLELQKLATQKPSTSGGLQISGADNLERSLRKTMGLELAQMESHLNLLATTGSTGPFIGLLGTVWGIMNSFHKIGATGSASLAVVAPGISEALFTTAIGLAAAIPAVVLYNHFITRIRREEAELNHFTADFLNVARRNFFKE